MLLFHCHEVCRPTTGETIDEFIAQIKVTATRSFNYLANSHQDGVLFRGGSLVFEKHCKNDGHYGKFMNVHECQNRQSMHIIHEKLFLRPCIGH